MVKYSNLLEISFWALKPICQRPFDNKKLGNAICIFWICAALFYVVLTVLLFFHINGDVDLLARTIEATTTFCQMFIKVIPLLIHRERLVLLYEYHLKFWNPDDYPEELRKDVQATFKFAYYIAYMFRAAVFATLVLFYMQPLAKKGELLIVCYVPNFPYAFEALLLGQYVYAYVFACFVSGFDNLYVSYCAHLVAQMKIVNYTLKNLDVKHRDYLNNFKMCIEYHKFLLSFTSEFLKIWSIPLLGQYILSIYLSCMELYLFVESLSNPVRIMLSTVYVFCLYFQFGLYCFPATIFTTEAENLAVEIYDSKWYEGTIAMQKNIGFVIMRAQKQFKFVAAGLAEINVEAFIVVFKASMSFYTLMRQMKEES